MHLHSFVTQFWPSTVDGVTLGSIYALFALGYTLVYGVLKLINFAHSEVFMVGTMSAMWIMHFLNISAIQSGFALVGALLLAALFSMGGSAATALALERVAYRPLRRRGASRLAALISAIGASFVLQQVFEVYYSNQYSNFPRLFKHSTLFNIGSAQITTDRVLIVVAAVVMMVALERTVALTKLGRGIRAVAQDPETATLMGVNIDRTIMYTFLLGGIMAGVAAVLWNVRFEQTRFDIGFLPGIKAFTAAVLGGIGNIRGALLGGLIIGLLELYGASVFGSQWRDTTVFVVLVLVLLFRPSGLLGESLARARA
ncbi:branched-chain amino acid ABC transporter permease [Acidiferrimicrobium sp. IK]|uniref:branched-chain amino acid ABC transporter permease n=1 Tax=Acidiferrimicrobium sp. IK TaxID=2871700 RepID=UPI0021CAF94C|nr:branched-chain amino acid ABC transporter permease [Acidiferrimicrobium sp. IK]MCU4183670.1 branched-chain amino acid ABC transporter permease [Acidiferrimicrobium sp. IK]